MHTSNLPKFIIVFLPVWLIYYALIVSFWRQKVNNSIENYSIIISIILSYAGRVGGIKRKEKAMNIVEVTKKRITNMPSVVRVG